MFELIVSNPHIIKKQFVTPGVTRGWAFLCGAALGRKNKPSPGSSPG
jgi:hypothetical protein